jgi:hypothetical protein
MDLGRIVLGIFLFAFLAVYYAWKWKRAGVVSDAMDAERLAARQSFELLKRDPRFFTLQQYLNTRHRTMFDRTKDPATYCIRFVGLMDGSGKYLFAPNDAGARYLIAYLERSDKPARIQASLDLQTGVCGEVELSLLASTSLRSLMD